MRMKIAVIGSRPFCSRVEVFTEHRTDISIEPYPYDVPDESPALLKELRPCDAILFSGSLPYIAAKDLLPSIPVPAVYLKQDETEIAATLLSVALRQPLHLPSLSIDVRDRRVLDNVLAASAPSEGMPAVYELKEDYALEDVVDFHNEEQRVGRAVLAVTSVHAVYDRLAAQGIPAVRMISVRSSFLNTLESLCQEALIKKTETSKAAVGILHSGHRPEEDAGLIGQLSELLHAHHSGTGDGTLFYTTQGAILAAVHQKEFRKAALQAEGRLAFGTGHTLTAAKDHAVSALRYMEKEDPAGLYMLDDKKELTNLYRLSEETVELRVTEPALANIAEQTALSPAVLSKLAAFGQTHQTLQFTANDLADHLGVSRRTAERTIKKLLSFRYVEAIGEEMTYRQGRPRAVYQLNFPVY